MFDPLKHTSTDLADAVAHMPAADDEWSPILTLGPCPDGGVTFATMTGPVLAHILAEKADRIAGADAKLAAADLLGSVGWYFGMILARLTLSGYRVGMMDRGAVAFVSREVRWESEGDSGIGYLFDIVLDPAGVTPMPSDADDHAHGHILLPLVEGLFAPLVAALHAHSRLSQVALWRIIGDAISGTFLEQGKTMGIEERAMTYGRSFVRQHGSRLYSKQTDYIQISVANEAAPDQPHTTEWFRARGGCCRYYTLPGEEYCSTCVLRDADSRDSMLRDHLRQRMVAAT